MRLLLEVGSAQLEELIKDLIMELHLLIASFQVLQALEDVLDLLGVKVFVLGQQEVVDVGVVGELVRDQLDCHVELLARHGLEVACATRLPEVLELRRDRLALVLYLEQLEAVHPVLQNAVVLEIVEREDSYHLCLEVEGVNVLMEVGGLDLVAL